jgi:glycerophosphoryl diester phosphodiesterase
MMATFMTGVSSSARVLPEWLTTRPIAHRGLHDAARPENTLPAFEAAMAAGYPIELDVHVLSDGEVIVFHDDDLKRATGLARSLLEETRSSIRAHRVFGTSHGISCLRDVLALVDGKVPLLIEIKAHRHVDNYEQAVFRSLVGYAGPYALQSFNPWTLSWFRKHAPHVVCGQLGGPLREDGLSAFERIASQRLLTLAVSRAQFLNYDLRALPDTWLGTVQRATGLPLLCWTVRNEADRQKAEALKLNYVFDNLRP